MTAVDHRSESPPRPSPLRRTAFWSGVGLLLVAVILLGYVGWELFGTNVVAHRRQAAIVERLQQQWLDAPPTEPGDSPPEHELGEADALVRIPRFGAGYVIPVLEGTSDDVLARGFGHFADTAGPGSVGNYALAGHRITHGEPLRRMPELRPGDQVIVETATKIYTYELDSDPNELVVPFTATWVIDDFPVNPSAGGATPDVAEGRRLITLTTCSELFHTDGRMIAFGHLYAFEAKTDS